MLVDIVLDDPSLFDEMLKNYPGKIKEDQIIIDDAIEFGDKRQYWFSRLDYKVLIGYLKENGSGNYAVYKKGKLLKKVCSSPLVERN